MATPKEDTNIARGNKARSLPGTLTFIGLRALDPLLQHQILAGQVGSSLISTLGSSTLAQGPSSNTGYAMIDSLGLSPYRLILLSMAVGSSVKHIIWKAFIGEEYMAPQFAGFVGVFNTVFNSLNSLFFIARTTSAASGRGEGPCWPGWPGARLLVGSGLFVAGMAVELGSEVQRKVFKGRRENAGVPHTTGLFGLARNINYSGYTLWRMGYAVAAGGWTWGAITGAFFFYDFSQRAVPSLNEYCERRYADLWHDYEKRTPHVLIPYIY